MIQLWSTYHPYFVPYLYVARNSSIHPGIQPLKNMFDHLPYPGQVQGAGGTMMHNG